MSVGFNTTSIDIIELPTKIPAHMPRAIDDCSLAFQLGFRNKIMWYVLQDTLRHYEVIRIPKKKGGVRIIHAPEPMIKVLLQRVHVKFLVPAQDRLGPQVTAYRKGKSARDAVLQHVPKCDVCDNSETGKTPKKHECPKRGVFIKMDLQDFFPTTTRAWIRRYFKSIGYSHTVASLLAGLLVVRDIPNTRFAKMKAKGVEVPEYYTGVPQGSPSSGAICNLVAAQRLDKPIMSYLKTLDKRMGLEGEWQWRYTRYSDDLSFTCGSNPTLEERQQIMDDLKNIIREAGYQVNGKKTRVSHSYHKRALLGMVFNAHPNYSKEEYLRVRAIVHNCAIHGFVTQFQQAKQPSAEALITWLRGMVNWIKQVNPNKGQKLLDEFNVALAIHEEEHHASIKQHTPSE